MEQDNIDTEVIQNEERLEELEETEQLEQEIEVVETEFEVQEQSVTEDEDEDETSEEYYEEENKEQENPGDTFKTKANLKDVEISINNFKSINPGELLGKLYDIRENTNLNREEKNQEAQEVIKEYTR